MPSLIEGKIRFNFPAGWEVIQYDSWAFYKNQFRDSCCGNKAVDFLAFDPADEVLWLIEVKDYRQHPRTKDLHVWDEMAIKSRDTLAGLVAVKANGVNPEKTWAKQALQKERLRFVLHLEQPTKNSKLFPRALDPAAIQQKLRQLIKPIDAHPRVVELNKMAHVAWTAQSIP